MKSRTIEALLESGRKGSIQLSSLMQKRVHNILLVSSLYDSFTFEQDGRLAEALFSEYLELNLRYAPRIDRVSTADGALERLNARQYDLVISMPRVGGMDVLRFCEKAKEIRPDLPVVLLSYHTRELPLLEAREEFHRIDRAFTWHGDVRLFLAIIKYIEDRNNVDNDLNAAGVQCIILIEDNISFYSSYLPLLYTELVVQTQDLMADGINHMEKLIRMRARPKILLATTYDEGLELYRRYRDHVLGVVTDVSLPREGKMDRIAGLKFAKMVREETWDRAVLVQSSDDSHREEALDIGAQFINKNSQTLLNEVRGFMQGHLGFGDFIFRRQDGSVVTRVGDLRSMGEALLEVPDESLIYHVTRNHFSLWLMARTEFDLAKALRPRQVEEFESPAKLREFLVDTLNAHLEKKRIGVVADFSTDTFIPESMFVRIGSGSLGGKGRGLAFINSLLGSYEIEDNVPGVNIYVPLTTVLATEVFEEFMEAGGLISHALAETDDDKITARFLESRLPDEAIDILREFLERVHYPLAVRSSSLQEDASHQPFAGLYRTYMIPNDSEDIDVRLRELANAIKMVYASTYYADPRSYFDATPNRLEEERMAIVIQEVVGRRHGNYIYPDLAGVARSYDYYPMEGKDPEDGVAMVALGLGRQVVDGGKCVRFSLEWPRKLYQFSSVEDFLENAQREFYALDMSKPAPLWREGKGLESNVVKLGLDVAESHGTLYTTGSTYIAENDAVYDGISRKGVRLVTLAGVLKHEVFPLALALKFLLNLGATAFSSPVEIEFAVNLRKKDEGPSELGFLQIRPLVVGADTGELNLDTVESSCAVCISQSALGQGHMNDIRDIVYVRDDNFDRGGTVEIAGEIETINQKMKDEGRGYILIGPGRWGTADRFYGVPVSWAQISNVQAIVETDIKGVAVQPSQGTHFFQNITSMGIPYFTVNAGEGMLDMDWMKSQRSSYESEHVRVLTYDEPLEIAIDGRNRVGVIMKPGEKPGGEE